MFYCYSNTLPKPQKLTAIFCLLTFLVSVFMSGCATNAAAQLESSVNDGLQLLAEYKFKEAELKFEEITKQAPDSVAGYKGLMTARLLQSKDKLAQEAIMAGLKKVNTPEIYAVHANYLAGQGDSARAAANYEKAIATDGAGVEVYRLYAEYLMKSGADKNTIAAVLDKAQQRFKDDFAVANLYAKFYISQNDAGLENSIVDSLKKSLKDNPDQYAAYKEIIALCNSAKDNTLLAKFTSGDNAINKDTLNMAIAYSQAMSGQDSESAFFSLYDKAADTAKSSPIVKAFYAGICAKAKQTKSAQSALSGLDKAAIKDAQLLALVSSAYAGTDNEAALAWAKEAVSVDKWAIEGYLAEAKALVDDPLQARIAAFSFIVATGTNPFDAITIFQEAGVEFLMSKLFGTAPSPFSIGGMKLGDSKQSIIDRFGKPEWSRPDSRGDQSPKAKDWISFGYGQEGFFTIDKNSKLSDIFIWNLGDFKSEKGIGAGSSLDDIKKAYADNLVIENMPEGELVLANSSDTNPIWVNQFVTSTDIKSNTRISFYIVNNKVMEMQIAIKIRQPT